MAKRNGGGLLDGLLNVAELERKRAALMEDVEKLDALMALLGGMNGSPRRGRKAAGRKGGKRGGGAGGKAPKEGTLGGKILAALKSGPKSNAQLLSAVKLSEKKRSQLSVNLNNLKKRGFVASVERGTWAAT